MQLTKALSTPRKQLIVQTQMDIGHRNTHDPVDVDREMAFRDWLLERNVDCETLLPELEQSLRLRFEQAVTPAPRKILMVPCDGLWPTRAYWAHRSQ